MVHANVHVHHKIMYYIFFEQLLVINFTRNTILCEYYLAYTCFIEPANTLTSDFVLFISGDFIQIYTSANNLQSGYLFQYNL